MPTYEYICESCGYKFEKFQQMSDKPLKECPKCGEQVKRLISGGMGVITSGGKDNSLFSGGTCCGRTERCDTPPCSDDGVCKR
ncbi:MAG TPA: zinc ribbon domain-containing protein [Candidatus Atribacteria bacterium]|nr:zinc ribbon domain-containing protein [Candidatus Atribacteria bacterium]